MKLVQFLVYSLLMLGLVACGTNEGSDSDGNDTVSTTPPPPADGFYPAPSQLGPIQFSHPEQLFGTLVQGDSVTKHYIFKNMSDTDQWIDSVIVSCPCAVATWPREAVPPGKIDTVTILFRTSGLRAAEYQKLFPVKVKGQDIPVTLYFNGKVEEAKGAVAP